MKMNHGFTLIETIISVALLGALLSGLGAAIYQTTNSFLKTNDYSKQDDEAYDQIQNANSTKAVTLDYEMTGYYKRKKYNAQTQSYSDDTSILDKSSNLKTYQDSSEALKSGYSCKFNVKTQTYTSKSNGYKDVSLTSLAATGDRIFNLDSANTGHLFKDYGISSFDDLPDTNYKELNALNQTWGKWAYIGWSTAQYTYYSTATKKYYVTGLNQIASPENNWQGIITKDNFDAWIKYLDDNNIKASDVNLYLTYAYSIDSAKTDETDILQNTKINDPTILTNKDISQLSQLATTAAQKIKRDGLSSLQSYFGADLTNSLYSDNGVEILHCRENGWALLANTDYFSFGNNLKIYYENSNGYQKFPKIGHAATYYGGVKEGFLNDVFNDAIGLNLNKLGSYTNNNHYYNVDYNYNQLFFGSNTQMYGTYPTPSVMMKLSKDNDTNTLTVTFYVGSILSNGTVKKIPGYEGKAEIHLN